MSRRMGAMPMRICEMHSNRRGASVGETSRPTLQVIQR